jgi:hypothetical protein
LLWVQNLPNHFLLFSGPGLYMPVTPTCRFASYNLHYRMDVLFSTLKMQ